MLTIELKTMKKRRRRRKHHFFRKLFVGVLAVSCSAGVTILFLRHYTDQLDFQSGNASYSEVEEVGLQYTVNKSSKNLRRSKIFAHRGFDEDSLENSFASFDAALLAGCPQIELDVRTSADGIFYICHDDNLQRIAGINKKISEMTSEELDEVVMLNQEPLHRLSDVFDRYRTQMLYLVEFKEADADAEAFYELLRQYPNLASNIQIQSFYPEVLERIHEDLPNMFKQLLISDYTQINSALSLDYIDSLALEQGLISENRISQIHEAGKEVWAWTVDDADLIRKYLGYGIDGVITDLSSAVEIAKEVS